VQKAVVSLATNKGTSHATVLIKHKRRSLRLKQRKPRLRIRTVAVKTKTQKPMDLDTYVQLGKSLPEDTKITIIRKAIEAEQGAEGDDADF
jgi:hypothetical protein